MFKVNKLAAIANAIISGHESFNKTMAAYPYPYNIALAGLGLAATASQISAIKSTSFAGGGSGGAAGGVSGGPTVAPPPSDIGLAPGPTGPTEIHITVDGTGKLDTDQAEAIAESLRELLLNGGEVIAA